MSIFKYFILLASLLALSSCMPEKEVKLDPNLDYLDFIPYGSDSLEIDSAISEHVINVPHAKKINSWHSSSFSLNNIPNNLYAKINLQNPKVKTYNLTTGSDYSARDNIVVANDTIYTSSQGTVFAYHLNNPSKLRWKKIVEKEKNNLVGGGIYYQGQYLAITTGGKDLVLLSSDTGKEVWRYRLSNISRSTPVIYQNRVYVVTIDNVLHAINLKTGFVEWGIKEAHENLGFLGGSSPESYEKSIIMPFSSGKILSINAETGKEIWSATLSATPGDESYINDIDMVPVIKDGMLYISSHNGVLYSINAAKGTLEWANRYAGGHSQLWVANDYLYTVNKNNQLLAIYKVTGSVKWATELESINKTNKDSVFFSDNSTSFNGPTMINGNLYITSSNGHLLVFNAVSGKKLKDIKIKKGDNSPAITAGEHIYFLNGSGTLTVIGQ
jgi:outer membrane protein assembly factor BamB